MEKILGQRFADLQCGSEKDIHEFFQYCRLFKEMAYDTVLFEVCITEILPDGDANEGNTIAETDKLAILRKTRLLNYFIYLSHLKPIGNNYLDLLKY